MVDRNWLFATLTFGTSSEAMLDIFNALNGSVYDFNPAGGVTWSFAFEPLPSVMLSHSAATGGNVLGLKPEDGNGVGKLFRPGILSCRAMYLYMHYTFPWV